MRDGRERGLIFVEGLRLAEEVLRSNVEIKEIFVRTGSGSDLLEREFSKSLPLPVLTDEFSKSLPLPVLTDEKVFNSLADTKNSQGVVLICVKPETNRRRVESELSNHEFPLVILLHETNNPSNLGAILRTAEAANVAGIIITKNSADAFSPKALRSAMGASLRLPIWTNADFSEVLDWAREQNLVSVCADVNSKKSYTEIDWKQPRLLIFGSEAHGLNVSEREKIDESLLIPMENNVESLNLAISCGIILFEAKRQKNIVRE